MTKEAVFNRTIAAYIEASNAGDLEAAASHFIAGAEVEDEGQTHRGIAEIRSWILKTREAYQFSLEALDHSIVGDQTIVTVRVSGAFPGSPIQLQWFFTLDGDKIETLKIRG